ncbi:J domain-containing protein [Lysobacter korlensis]|uniref:J domain-containing protein n=1 Tax=Lysobacter korlensis TaxID=553636 RepID=A0ABV6RVZ7_9GAMM
MDPATAARVLGVSLDASRADIERAFRRRARLEHPDLTGDATAFAAVTQARDVLVRAEGWRTAAADPPRARTTGASAARRGFDLPPPVLALLCVLLVAGSLVEGLASTSPFAPLEPVLRSGFLVGTVVGYALTRRRVLGILSAIAIVTTAVATLVWVSFGSLLGGALMAPAIVLLVLHGRNRAL